MGATNIVDTNLLVRLITYDVPELAHKAEGIIEELSDGKIEVPLYVVAEVVYVLAFNTAYMYTRTHIKQCIMSLIDIPQFSLSRKVIENALDVFSRTKLDFVDCLLFAEARSSGLTLLTFDRNLKKTFDSDPQDDTNS